MNISIIGCGNVGSTIAKELIDLDLDLNLNIIDPSSLSGAVVSDLSHATSLKKQNTLIYWNHFERLAEANYIFLAAAKESTTIGDRLQKAQQQIEMLYSIFKDFKTKVLPYIIVISNPVDIMTYHTYLSTKLPAEQIIGTGTYLETFRFQYCLSQIFGVKGKDIEGCMLGEHGNSAFPAFSTVKIKGFDNQVFKEKIIQAAKDAIQAPYKIRSAGAFTKYAISKCAIDIFLALHYKTDSLKPLGLILNKKNQTVINCKPICLSIPSILKNGKVSQLSVENLPSEELKLLKKSAEVLEKHL